MREIRFVLTPKEVEMIADALNLAYDGDDGDFSDNLDALMDLCSVFNVLNSTGKFVKVGVDEYTIYDDEAVHEDTLDEDFEDTDGEDDVADAEDDETAWDTGDGDDDEDCDGHNNCGCGCCDDPDSFEDDTRPDPEDAWNSKEPWTTE